MRRLAPDLPGQAPALTRLATLAPLSNGTVIALERALAHTTPVPARAELAIEGQEIAAPRMIATGWAARVRIMADGRRQLLSFLLPGDFIGLCRQSRPLAVSSVVAITDLLVCSPPPHDFSPDLAEAYAMSGALEEAYLLAHIIRLGRLHAQERVADLLLELNERLSLNGLAVDGRFEMPVTQEVLADALGLTSVHINRMIQLWRHQGDLKWQGRNITLTDPSALARKVGRSPVRVSATR